MKAILMILTGLLAAPSSGWAWGDKGHQTICALALRLVTLETRQKIDQIVSTYKEARSFGEACTWADHPRKRAVEHYLNLPRDSPLD